LIALYLWLTILRRIGLRAWSYLFIERFYLFCDCILGVYHAFNTSILLRSQIWRPTIYYWYYFWLFASSASRLAHKLLFWLGLHLLYCCYSWKREWIHLRMLIIGNLGLITGRLIASSASLAVLTHLWTIWWGLLFFWVGFCIILGGIIGIIVWVRVLWLI